MTEETFKIEGIKEVIEALEGLPDELVQKFLKTYTRRVLSKFIVDKLKGSLPYSPKSLKGIKVVNDRNDKSAAFGGLTLDSFWLRFTEKGTKVRKTKKGFNRGQITAKNKILPIIDQQINPIIEDFNEQLGIEIEKILKRKIKSVNKKLGI